MYNSHWTIGTEEFILSLSDETGIHAKIMIYKGKVYGPYLRKDGRQHVIIVDNNIKTTVSYPKFLMENHLGRKLAQNETVDHIDNDFTNNDFNNLKVKDRVEHIKDDMLRIRVKYICPICNKNVVVEGKKAHSLRISQKRGKKGPYCSRKCAGKGGKQYNTDLIIEYFQLK